MLFVPELPLQEQVPVREPVRAQVHLLQRVREPAQVLPRQRAWEQALRGPVQVLIQQRVREQVLREPVQVLLQQLVREQALREPVQVLLRQRARERALLEPVLPAAKDVRPHFRSHRRIFRCH